MIFIHAVHKIYKFFDEQLLVQTDIEVSYLSENQIFYSLTKLYSSVKSVKTETDRFQLTFIKKAPD